MLIVKKKHFFPQQEQEMKLITLSSSVNEILNCDRFMLGQFLFKLIFGSINTWSKKFTLENKATVEEKKNLHVNLDSCPK